MKIHFWGVRGSIPTPLSEKKLRQKVSAIVQRIRPSDLETAQTREAFLADLPEDLFGTIGGNTTCLEIGPFSDKVLIFDAGTGIRELGANIQKSRKDIREFHIFFTHFHWDHIQGLPFFTPAYIPGNRVFFYSPRDDFERVLRDQMKPPYFPIEMDTFNAEIRFVHLDAAPVEIGEVLIAHRRVNHPGGCSSYKISIGGKNVIFSTDTEITREDFNKTEANLGFFGNTQILILDSQYTLGEAIEKYNWGHTSYSMAVELALEWGIGTLVLFHHEPNYDDAKMHSILRSAKWYENHIDVGNRLEVIMALEGRELAI